MPSNAVLWFRRDLRVHDHPALHAALDAADTVSPVFVLDDALLDGRWPAANRRWFMRESLVALSADLQARGAPLRILRGRPADVLPAFAREAGAHAVFASRDSTPYGRRRDVEVAAALATAGIGLHSTPGLYVHAPDDLATLDGRPFVTYGPFRRAWEARPRRAMLPAPDRVPGPPGASGRGDPIPDLGRPTADAGLIPAAGEAAARARLDAWIRDGLDAYADRRDRMDLLGTSRLSQDLRWGLLSPVEIADRAEGEGEGRRAYIAELAWREFYAHVLWHHPRVLREPFGTALQDLPWRDDPAALDAWREGRTGYPVVDAAMRQLRASGFVHNRARMVAASFLVKHLLVDWREGEAEFMRHLVDGDVASNGGGWQWIAGTGPDAQPSFRILNPVLQGRRFDPLGDYVRRWVPELAGVEGPAVHEPWTLDAAAQARAMVRIGVDYAAPIVDHVDARERALAVYRETRARAIGRSTAAGGDPG